MTLEQLQRERAILLGKSSANVSFAFIYIVMLFMDFPREVYIFQAGAIIGHTLWLVWCGHRLSMKWKDAMYDELNLR